MKTVIAWASIAYAFGFVTVTLHTYRLRLPVLEVLSAIYIWVGLPLAALAFFGKRLGQFVKSTASQHAQQLQASWNMLTQKVDEKDLNILAASFAFFVTIMPLLYVFEEPLTALIRKTNIGGGKSTKLAVLWLRRIVALFEGAYAIIGMLNTLVMVLILISFVYLYVWHLYPLIPQSLGGGRPKTVQLLVLTEKASAISPYIYNSPGAPNLQTDKTIVTPPVSLLYATKEHYYLQSQAGFRFSLSADAVEGVIWNPR